MKNIIAAIRLTLFTLVTLSGIYPLFLWGFGNLVTPRSAQGSLVYGQDGKTPVGSELIAQKFTQPRYFWSRPSAADYDATAAGGSNFGPTNPKLTDRAKATIANYRPQIGQQIPSDLVAASGSGLDPHITVAAAYFQVPRVVRHRKVGETTMRRIIDALAVNPSVGWTGERIVNVLQLNLELDKTLLSKSP
jgi:potassium-transporting ATPase KdpC subunit